MSDPTDMRGGNSAVLRAELERLEAMDRELASADAEFEHQARRYGDGIERLGGQAWDIERDLKRVDQNRKRIAGERADLARRIAELRARLDNAADESGG